MSFFNPFSQLTVKRKDYQFANLLSDNFLTRMHRTFFIFYGNESHLGVVDYLFPFTRMINKIPPLFNNTLLYLAVGSLVLMANLTKILLSICLTLLVAPIVLITHLALQPKLNALNEEVQKILVRKLLKEDFLMTDVFADEDLQVLDEKEYNLSELEEQNEFYVTPWYVPSKYNPTLFSNSTLPFPQQKTKMYLKILRIHDAMSHGTLTLNIPVRAIEVSNKNEKGIRAMLKTNTFFSTDLNEEDINEIERRIEKKESTKSLDFPGDIFFKFN